MLNVQFLNVQLADVDTIHELYAIYTIHELYI
jgi:hypothetical protein